MIRRTEATIHPRTSRPCGLAFDRYRLALGQKRLLAGDEHVREPAVPRLPHAGAIRQGVGQQRVSALISTTLR